MEVCRVLVISGSHGEIKENSRGQPLEHNGSTGFSNFDFLDYELYRSDCKTVGVAPRLAGSRPLLGNPRRRLPQLERTAS